MGGSYALPCPVIDIGGISFPWTGSVTSSDHTSGSEESRDHRDATGQSCDDADRCEPPETEMATSETSRDPSVVEEDCGKPADGVRSSDDGAVTSQPKPEIVTEQQQQQQAEVFMAGRVRFRDAALTITTQLHELDNADVACSTLNADVAMQLRSTTSPHDTTDALTTSDNTVSAADRGDGAGRRLLLEDILRARARTQQVGDRTGEA